MNNDKLLPAVQRFPLADIKAMAEAVAKSRLFGMKTPEEALALMLVSDAEGLHPAIAARDYHVIQGRPTLKADAMLARFQTAGGTVKWGDYTNKKVSATFSHPQGGSVTVEWTMEMAEKAQLTKNPTWRQYPRQMLRARTVSEGIRTVFPGVVVGCYTPEELEDTTIEPPKQQPAKAKQPKAIDAEVLPTETKKPELSEFQDKYFPRVKAALDFLFGTDTKSKMTEIAALTTFKGEDGNMVDGVQDYRRLDGMRLKILAHKLESAVEAAKKNAAAEVEATFEEHKTERLDELKRDMQP